MSQNTNINSHEFEETFFNRLESELPPVFSRKAVSQLLGGAICAGTLANLGNEGPPFIRMGRHAVYERTSFLAWLRKRSCNRLGTPGCSS